MARLGRGRRSKPIYLRGRSVTTPTPLVRNRVKVYLDTRTPILRRRWARKPVILKARSVPTPTPLVRKRILVELQTTNRLKYFRTHNMRHFRLIKPPIPQQAPYVRPKITALKPTINRVRYINRRNSHHPIILKARSTPTVNWVRPKIVVEKTTLNRGKYPRHRKPIILRAPQALIVTTKVRQPVVVMSRRTRLVRSHRHNQAIILRSRVASFKPRQPVVIRRRSVRPFTRQHKPIILRGVSTPTFQPRLFKPYVVNKNQRRLAQFRQRNKSPFIFYFPGGAAAIPPPPDTGHHTTLFLTRFGFYV